MKLEELKQDDWYKEKPEIIRQAIDQCPPTQMYTLESGYECYIESYEEPDSGLFEDVTVTVKKTGRGGPFPGVLNENRVFGVRLNEITKIETE